MLKAINFMLLYLYKPFLKPWYVLFKEHVKWKKDQKQITMVKSIITFMKTCPSIIALYLAIQKYPLTLSFVLVYRQ